MTKRLAFTAFVSGAFALAACSDKKPPPKPRVRLALLGKNSAEVIAHFESTCPGRLIRAEKYPPIRRLACHLSNHAFYAMTFDDARERITELEIASTLADAFAIYDRAFAPIVPDETREVLRQSLREPSGTPVFRKSGGEVAMSFDVKRAREGNVTRIAWSMVDLVGE